MEIELRRKLGTFTLFQLTNIDVCIKDEILHGKAKTRQHHKGI